MENSKRKFNNFAIVIIIVALAVALMWTLSYTYSNPAINIKGGTGLDIYVSGPYVQSDGQGYLVTKDSVVTITAFNNTKIFGSYDITVNDGTTEKPLTSVVSGIDIYKPEISFSVKTNQTLIINANTTAVNPKEKGTAFSNAYLLRDHAECQALYEILNADIDSIDYIEEEILYFADMFGFSSVSEAQSVMQKAYFKVTTNILIDSEEFYGIGNERFPFKGKIDFLNNAIYMNLRNSDYSERFGDDNILNTGFFGIVEATDTEPVIIRNMNINGSVYFNDDSGSDKTLNTGTIAGLSTGNVIYQNITNSVSVSINDTCNINTGAGFGILSSPLQNWSNYVFTGKYVTIEANTTGEGCNVNVGGFAAILSDTYCMDFKTETINCTLSGNSAGAISGNCNVGGVFGLVRNTGIDNMIIDDIILQPQEDFRLISKINNSAASLSHNSQKNVVVGGVIGNFENSKGKTIFIGTMAYTSKNADNVSINIEALTSKEDSKGNVYAGGLIGYIPLYNDAMKIEHFNLRNNDVVVFNADVDISATNNGYGEAFAGGLYGYNIPSSASIMQSSLRTITLSSENKKLNVLAIQESTAKSFNNSDLNTVAAGFITSVLPKNYTLSNLTINIDNGILKAVRQIGAKCLGPIYAGGFSGTASGNNTSTVFIKNITLNYNNTEIAALGMSFDSISISSNNTSKYYNNLCVGSFIGYIENYGTNNVNTSTYTVSNNYGIENINVNINNSDEYENTFVKGTFNAKSGALSGSTQTGMDNVTEAYVGGIIGHIRNTYMHNLNIEAKNKKAFIEYSCDYDPDTAAVGGILGSTFLGTDSGIDGGTVKNLYIRGKAHFNSENVPSGGTYDLYVGGAVGVGGFNGYECVLKNIFVYNSEIRAIGENEMLTYAGGVVSGLWWSGTGIVYNCASIECEIIASSIKTDAFAGGVVALMQPTPNTKIISSYCINSNVAATSVEQTATASGVVAQQKNNSNSVVKDCISSATVFADGNSKNIYPISPATISNSNGNTYNNYYDPYKVLNGNTDSDTLTADKFSVADYYTILALYDSGKQNEGSWIRPSYYYNIYSAYNISSSSSSFTIYNNYSNYNNSLASLSVDLGDNDVVTLQNGNTCKPTGNTGVTYGLLKLYINAINEEFTICSYPIYYDSTKINYTLRPTTDDGVSINASTYTEYVEDYKLNVNYYGKNDTYIKVQTGKHHNTNNYPNYTEGIKIDFGDFDIPRFELHNANDAVNSSNIFTAALNINNKIGQFTLSNNIIIEYNEHSISVIPRENISKRVILKIKFYDDSNNSNNVVIDFVPNYITDLDIYIAEDETPYLYKDDTDTNNPIYVFANTDVAVIEAKEIHNFPWLGDTDVDFSLVGNSISGVTVNSNGMVKLSNVSNGTEFQIMATYVGNVKADSNTISKTITLRISKEIAFETDLIGTKLTTTRKLVKSYPFVFTVSPLHGYGYSPTIYIEIDGTPIFDSNGKTLNEYTADVTEAVTLIEGKCTYTYKQSDGSYTINFNEDFMDNDYSRIYVKVEFPAIYNLIFDSGPLIEKLNSSRYYIYQVKRGTIIDSALVEQVINGINNSILLNIPYGFECKGFYLTERADNLSGYGDSFYDLDNLDKPWKVYAPLYFYARWTYDIIVDAPDMVNVESNFPLGLIEESSSSGLQIVPINTLHGMEFSLKPDEKYEGIPDFDMYVIKKNEDNTFTHSLITDKCILSEDKSYYYIDPFYIEGLLYLRIYPDNIAVNGIMNEDIDYIDKNILDNGEFYIKYSVNYTESGISVNDTVSNKVTDENGGINLNFSVASGYAITKGTTIRLYHHINKTPIGEYDYIASNNSNSIYLKDFINTSTGKSILEDRYSYTGLVYSETYYFVVSFPLDSENQHKPTADYTKVTAESNIICNMLTTYEGSFSKDYASKVSFNDRPYEKVDNDYTVYNGAVLICTNTQESINITWTFNGLGQVATNYRFLDNILIWSIKKDGLFSDTEKNNLINKFGQPMLITGNTLYYVANLQPNESNPNVYSLSLDISDISSSYEISLSITRTPKTPASAIKLWSNK